MDSRKLTNKAGAPVAADAERDIRGVACKFYTEQGNWDLLGNDTPTFFLRDVHNFPDLNRAVKRDPRAGMRSAQNNWDFWILLPETFHQTTMTEVHDYHRDGFMRSDGNYGGAPAYSPNSMGEWAAQPEIMEPPLVISGALYAYDPKEDSTDDCFKAGAICGG